MDLQIVPIAGLRMPGAPNLIPQFEATILKKDGNILIYTGESVDEAKALFHEYCVFTLPSSYPTTFSQ